MNDNNSKHHNSTKRQQLGLINKEMGEKELEAISVIVAAFVSLGGCVHFEFDNIDVGLQIKSSQNKTTHSLNQITNNPNYRQKLREILDNYFNDDEIACIWFDLGFDTDNLSGDNKLRKIISLIERCEKRNRIVDLLNIGAKIQPNAPWKDIGPLPFE